MIAEAGGHYTPHYMEDHQNREVAKWTIHKYMKRKDVNTVTSDEG
jgi:hypothetical protein